DHGGRNDQRENELFHGPAFDLVGQGPANCRALSIYVQDPGWPYRRSSWTSANNRVWDCGAGFRKVLCGVLGPMARLIQDPCRPSRVMGWDAPGQHLHAKGALVLRLQVDAPPDRQRVGLCHLSRLLIDDVSAILPCAQAVSRMPSAIAALRMCCQRRV